MKTKVNNNLSFTEQLEQGLVYDVYRHRKELGILMAKFIEKHLSDGGLERFKDCGSFLSFVANDDLTKQKLYKSNFCKNRFCPMCSWRKACKDAVMLSTIMKAISKEKDYRFIFVTLTVPNVSADELSETINHFNKSFQRLSQRKIVSQMNHGYVRKLELTYNEERDDYHPHFHVIFAVDKSYFDNKRKYIKHAKWLKLWQESTRDDTITQVNVQAVKSQLEDDRQTVNEMSKYVSKHTDMITSEEVFDTFYTNLRGRQLTTYNKVFKEYKKKYENNDLSEEFMIIDKVEYRYLIAYYWNNFTRQYKVYEDNLGIRPLTEEEYREVNGKEIDGEEFVR